MFICGANIATCFLGNVCKVPSITTSFSSVRTYLLHVLVLSTTEPLFRKLPKYLKIILLFRTSPSRRFPLNLRPQFLQNRYLAYTLLGRTSCCNGIPTATEYCLLDYRRNILSDRLGVGRSMIQLISKWKGIRQEVTNVIWQIKIGTLYIWAHLSVYNTQHFYRQVHGVQLKSGPLTKPWIFHVRWYL